MDLHRRQPIWLHQGACLAHNDAQITIWENQIIMLEILRPKTLKSGNPRINFLHHRGIVTRLRSHHFQALPSLTTLPHSTLHQVRNEARVVQPKDIRVMGHRGKDTTSPKEDIVDLKCSHLGNSQDRGRHLQVHLECHQHRLETFQSVGRDLPALLHTDKSLVTWETSHQPPKGTISAGCGTAQDRCCRDCRIAPITRYFLR